jgi:hypothetical protein
MSVSSNRRQSGGVLFEQARDLSRGLFVVFA